MDAVLHAFPPPPRVVSPPLCGASPPPPRVVSPFLLVSFPFPTSSSWLLYPAAFGHWTLPLSLGPTLRGTPALGHREDLGWLSSFALGFATYRSSVSSVVRLSLGSKPHSWTRRFAVEPYTSSYRGVGLSVHLGGVVLGCGVRSAGVVLSLP
jgi:hypothetical protein